MLIERHTYGMLPKNSLFNSKFYITQYSFQDYLIMALFQLLWLRRLVRRYTNPIPEHNAGLWKRRLAIGYMIFAWNAFGIVALMIYNGKGDWAKAHGLVPEDHSTPAQQWTKTLGIKDATVYRVSGLNVKKYSVHNEKKDETAIDITKESNEESESMIS